MKNDLLNYLCCPKCLLDLTFADNFLLCSRCSAKYEINDGIVKMMPNLTKDQELSVKKWDEIYQRQLKNQSFYKEYDGYKKLYYKDTYGQLFREKKIDKDLIYLEIGCGLFFLGQGLAGEAKLIIGIDFCYSALKIAKKMMDEKGIANYLLIQGSVLNLPIANNQIDLIYGGGVIEHFKNTQQCVDEIYRVLKIDGVSFNTVPYLNIGSITYRQIWGNIPNAPIIKQITEFVHIKLLKKKYMIFGYEMSFLSYTLKRIHRRAGFKKIKIDKFNVKLAFDFIPLVIRKPLIWLASNSRLFWPMIKVIGQK